MGFRVNFSIDMTRFLLFPAFTTWWRTQARPGGFSTFWLWFGVEYRHGASRTCID